MENGHLPCRNLLLAATGSIHSSQLPQYLTHLKRTFASDIHMLMTEAATRMCSPQVLEVIIEHPVETGLVGSAELRVNPIKAAKWADLFLVLPATANILAKAANGIADDLVSTAIVASDCPVAFAPAMNPTMWRNPAVQRNVARLREDGYYIIPPQPIVSVTTGYFSEGLGPTLEATMPHLWHLCLRRRRQAYWSTATAEPPRSPSLAAPRRTLALRTKAQRGAASADARDHRRELAVDQATATRQ